jgi:predicted ATPase
MKIKSVKVENFKRFFRFEIDNIPESAKLVILTGPNGSGKSSLFEAFNFWGRWRRGQGGFDPEYLLREKSGNEFTTRDTTKIEFYDFASQNQVGQNLKKCFYIRSAYRHEADFTSSQISNVQDALDSNNNLTTLIAQEARISENYNRIVGEAVKELFNGIELSKTKLEIRDRLIGEIRNSMTNLFGDLTLSGTGNPTSGGTFRFAKGAVADFHYKNLSGGEKAAFDLLLDFIVKKQTFDDTVFCIDEPELHMHTKLQGELLEQLFLLLPLNCQLWISTHSIGMARKASELYHSNPGQVSFLDFHGQDFDQPITLKPIFPTRDFWKNMFNTALDDLSQLVVPAKVVFCEGKRLGSGGRRPAFDVAVYSTIFFNTHPDTDFVPLGGDTQVSTDGKLAGVLLKKLAPGIQTWMLFDRDDRSAGEIQDLKKDGIKALGKRDLESYLWDDEILTKHAIAYGQPENVSVILGEKARLLSSLSPGTAPDDIKAISGQLYNFCKSTLKLTQRGNDSEAFAIGTLAPLISPDTRIYHELDQIIF